MPEIIFTPFFKFSCVASLKLCGKFRKTWKGQYRKNKPYGGSGLEIQSLKASVRTDFNIEKDHLLYIIKCVELKFIYVGYTSKGLKDFSGKSGRLGKHILKLLAIKKGGGYHVQGWRRTAIELYEFLRNNTDIDNNEKIECFINNHILISIGQISGSSDIKRHECFVLNYFKNKHKGYNVLNEDQMQMHKIKIIERKSR